MSNDRNIGELFTRVQGHTSSPSLNQYRLLDIENRRLLHWGTQGMDSLFNEFPAPGIFLSLGLFGRSKRMVEPPPTHDSISPDTGRHRIEAGR